MIREVNEAVQQRKRRAYWDKYKWMVVLAITAIICWIMYIIGNPDN